MSGVSKQIAGILEKLYIEYQKDAFRIAARIKAYKADFLIKSRSGAPADELPGIDELAERYRNISSDPPHMMRIATLYDMTYIWRHRDIAIVLGRDNSVVARNIKAMELRPEWQKRIEVCRRKCKAPHGADIYQYSEEIFTVILDYYARTYIETRIITKRKGKRLPLEEEKAVWEYWEALLAGRTGTPMGIKNDAADDEYGNVPPLSCLSTDMSASGPRSLRSVLSDCAAILFDHKALSLALAFLVNCTDLADKHTSFIYYFMPVALLPLLIYVLKRLTGALAQGDRRRLTMLCTYLLIAGIVWTGTFCARAFNGDLGRSATGDIIAGMSQKIDRLDEAREETKQKLTNLDYEVSDIVREREDDERQKMVLSEERINEAKAFVERAAEGGIKYTEQDLGKQIEMLEESLNVIDKAKCPDIAAGLFLARADVLTLQGMLYPEAALVKFAEARNSINEAVSLDNIRDGLLAEAYTSLGGLYIREGDIRSKPKMLKLAEESLVKAREYIDDGAPLTQGIFYSAYGSLKTAQSELLRSDWKRIKEEQQLLEEALEYFEKAEDAVKDFPAVREQLDMTIQNETGIVIRKLANVHSRLGKDDAEAMCREMIKQYESKIAELDVETEQSTYFLLNLQCASLSIQLFDILFDPFIIGKGKNLSEAVLAECADILSSAENTLRQAKVFSNEDDRLTYGRILLYKAMICCRYAMLTGGDTKKIDTALEFYDAALAQFPERSNLQLNMLVAMNKAMAMYNAGVLLNSSEYIKEAETLSSLYLKNYSSTGYEDVLTGFRRISENCAKWAEKS